MQPPAILDIRITHPNKTPKTCEDLRRSCFRAEQNLSRGVPEHVKQMTALVVVGTCHGPVQAAEDGEN